MVSVERKNILIFHPGTIGDVLAFLPVYDHIRKLHPDDRIIQMCLSRRQAEVAHELLLPTPYVDEVIYADVVSGSVPLRCFRLWRAALKLRSPANDTLYFCAGGWPRQMQLFRRYMTFLRFAGFRRVVGGADPAGYSDIRQETPRQYQMFMRFLFGKDDGAGPFDIALSDDEQRSARAVMESFCIPEGKIPVAIGIGGKKQVCLYPPKQYIEVLRLLPESLNLFPVLFGGSDAKGAEQEILAAFPRGHVGSMLDRGLNLRETIALLSLCRLYCGNDTGTMHMAAAAKIPCIGIFAAHTYRGKWSPIGERNIVLRHDPACAGCLRTRCDSDPARCIAAVTPHEIYDAIKKILN